jgi:hypothetical protein
MISYKINWANLYKYRWNTVNISNKNYVLQAQAYNNTDNHC